MDPLLTKAAGTAGSALSKYAVRAVAGSAHSRALNTVYQRAVDRAVAEVAESDPDLSKLDLRHAVGLLEMVLAGAEAGDVPLISAREGTGRAVEQLRARAAGSGLDPDTFPLPFDRLVDVLLRLIAEEATQAAVDQDGNPLFPAAALARLDDLRASVRTMAHLVPLSGQVREALLAAARGCEAADRRLYTPDVLLALLHLPDGSVATCFNMAAAGLAPKIVGALTRYLAANVTQGFLPIEWAERPEIRQAQTYAWSHGLPAVTGPSLLLGVLDTPSTTREGLAKQLGPLFDVIRDIAVSQLDVIVVDRTPFIVFDEELDLG